ncbi:hypothetical protein D3C72_1262360 [compost metagenome]
MARAGATFHMAISIGKFQGVTAATTPIASRVTKPRAEGPDGATSSYSLSQLSAYHCRQSSTACTSNPALSLMGLPMSRVSSNANSSMCCSNKAAKRSMTRLRSFGVRCDHTPLSKARRAAFTAISTSSAWHEATWLSTRPSRGEMLAKVSPLKASTKRPSMKAWPSNWSSLARCCTVVRSMKLARLMGFSIGYMMHHKNSETSA